MRARRLILLVICVVATALGSSLVPDAVLLASERKPDVIVKLATSSAQRGVTSLGRPAVRYRVPDKPYAILRRAGASAPGRRRHLRVGPSAAGSRLPPGRAAGSRHFSVRPIRLGQGSRGAGGAGGPRSKRLRVPVRRPSGE